MHQASTHWVESLPLVVLNICMTVKRDLQCSVAELVYGTTLHPPGEFFKKLPDTNVDSAAIVQDFQDTMRNIKAPLVCPQLQRNIYINQDLASSTHIFVRHNATCKPLQSPYDGPCRVLRTANKFLHWVSMAVKTWCRLTD